MQVEAPVLARVIVRVFKEKHPDHVIADALLIAAAEVERRREQPRSDQAQQALDELKAS